jgi:hypothetical protein
MAEDWGMLDWKWTMVRDIAEHRWKVQCSCFPVLSPEKT